MSRNSFYVHRYFSSEVVSVIMVTLTLPLNSPETFRLQLHGFTLFLNNRTAQIVECVQSCVQSNFLLD